MSKKVNWFVPAALGLNNYWCPTREEFIEETGSDEYEWDWSYFVHELLKSCPAKELVMFNASEEVFNSWREGYVALSEHIKKTYPELEISNLDLEENKTHVNNLQFKKDGILIGSIITVWGVSDFIQVLLIKSEYQDGFIDFFESEEYPNYL